MLYGPNYTKAWPALTAPAGKLSYHHLRDRVGPPSVAASRVPTKPS